MFDSTDTSLVTRSLLTVSRAAAEAHLSRRVMTSLIDAGEVQTIRTGTRTWVVGASLEELKAKLHGRAVA